MVTGDPTTDLIFSAVGSLGFPIVTAWYLLVIFKKSLDTLNGNVLLLIEEIKANRKVLGGE